MCRKLAYFRCCAVIVARQKHDSPATMYGRILVEDGSGQMVEALNQSRAGEGLGDGPGRRLSPEFLRGHAVGIGHIDDGLTLPGRQRFCNISVRLETDRQEHDVRLDRVRQFLGMIVGPIAAAAAAKLSGSRVVAMDTSMPLRANAFARAWPILPKPIIA